MFKNKILQQRKCMQLVISSMRISQRAILFHGIYNPNFSNQVVVLVLFFNKTASDLEISASSVLSFGNDCHNTAGWSKDGN